MKKKSHYVYEVFTPAQVAELNYIERDSLNSRIVSALRTPGKQLIVFGPSGVGKSSLLRNTLKRIYTGEVVTHCMSGLTFDAIVLEVFDKLNTFYIDKMREVDTISLKGSLAQDYFAIKSTIESVKTESTESNLQRAVGIQLTPQRLADFLGEANYCWVLEDFHKMDPLEKTKLSQIMKVFMDKSTDYPNLKIIALGAVNTGREVVEYDIEMKRRVAELEVPLMSPQELRQILNNGEKLLNVKFNKNIREGIVDFSNGLASICHAIALFLCEEKDVYETYTGNYINFNESDLEKAISRYVEEESDSIKDKFDKAFKQKESKYKNAELIVKALIQFSPEGATNYELYSKIKDIRSDYPQRNLTLHLETLQYQDKGALIMYDNSSGKYLFSEPFYRPYAIAMFNEKPDGDEWIKHSLKNIIGQLAYTSILEEVESKYLAKN